MTSSSLISKGQLFIAIPVIKKFVNVVLLFKSVAVIVIVAMFSLTEISSKTIALFDLAVISILSLERLTKSTLSVVESILILGVPVKETTLL